MMRPPLPEFVAWEAGGDLVTFEAVLLREGRLLSLPRVWWPGAAPADLEGPGSPGPASIVSARMPPLNSCMQV